MPKLAEPVKAFIVERLACFDKPSEVADAVGEEFPGVKITRQHVEEYDPEKRCTTKKWVALHAAVRKAFLEHRAGLAITHHAWRQREREDLVRRAKKQRNYKLAAEILDAAAKEEGGVHLTRPRGGELPAESEEQRIQALRAHMDEMDAATLGAPSGAPALVVTNGAAA